MARMSFGKQCGKRKGMVTLMQTLNIKKVRDGAILPKRATQGSAGMDLCACIDAPVTLAPGQLAKIPTGIAIGIADPHYAAFVFARSGLAVKHGVALSNGVGVIDSDYTGEVQVGLCNLSDAPYEIRPGERIAQLVLMPVALPQICEVDTLDQTARGDGGFGSTGR